MRLTSFIYQYILPVAGDTRDPVIIDCDFSALFPTPTSKVVLLYAALSGMRHNTGGPPMGDPGAFSARLLGDFNSNNDPVYTISSPRAGDSIASFDGLSFSSSIPFIPTENTTIFCPVTFQIEFLPSSHKGDNVGDLLEMFCTIGFRTV